MYFIDEVTYISNRCTTFHFCSCSSEMVTYTTFRSDSETHVLITLCHTSDLYVE
jgi:hypothetical protein